MIDLRTPVNLPPTGKSYAVKGDTRFPTFMYHAIHGAKVFKTEQAFNEAGDGWVDSPAKLVDAVVPVAPVLPAASAPSAPIATPSAATAPVDIAVDTIAPPPELNKPRAFTAEELKSVHKESAGDVIDAVERSRDVAFVQFVLDVEAVNPVKVRPSVIQAGQARLATLTKE